MNDIRPILELKNLCVTYNTGFGHVDIIKNISFKIEPGKVLGLTGESGAGKSILALSILKLLSPTDGFNTKGSVIFNEIDLYGATEVELCTLRGNDISIVFQNPLAVLNPVKKCGTQILEAIEIHRPKSPIEHKKEVIKVLVSVGLNEAERFYNAYPYELSGGELQRICIAMAFINKPKLIIIDEATASLDVMTSKDIIALLMSIKQSTACAFIFISHDIVLLKKIADAIILIKDGEIIDTIKPFNLDMSQLSDYTRSYLNAGFNQPKYDSHVLSNELPILDVSMLSKSFYHKSLFSFTEKFIITALKDVTFSIHNGDILGVLGESGSGKSTLAKTICGLITDYTGVIHFKQRNLKTFQNRKINSGIQMIFQDAATSLNPKLKINYSLKEVILLYHEVKSNPALNLSVAEILEKVSLPESCLLKYPHQLSGGQKQRICLARTLLAKPKLIIFDESLSALDKFNQQKMMDLILDLQKEMRFAALFISHDPALIKYLCSEVIVLDAGKIVEQGKIENLFNKPNHIKTKQLIDHIE
ncbi:MAG: ABC transporter ATP-binding protein [Saprospiraceae bacterium]|nr:ABC transporter ATP-binding protein [Saprospiraceae bacterium]